MPNVVMFATTCSKPELMNAVIAAKMSRIFATSFSTRAAIQIARQTSRLQRMPRVKSSTGPSAAFAASMPASISPAAAFASSTPEATMSPANASAPTRFAANIASIPPRARRGGMLRISTPWVEIIIAEVTSSPPANTTMVSATPNTTPETSFAKPSPAATSGPAVQTMSTTPMPM